MSAYLSISSNQEPQRHIRNALHSLRARYGALRHSHVYESYAVHGSAANFCYLVVELNTQQAPSTLQRHLLHIETETGYPRHQGPQPASYPLRLDLLLFDDAQGQTVQLFLPADKIAQQATILRPLAELAPFHIHPGSGKNYWQLWHDFDKRSHPLWETDIKL